MITPKERRRSLAKIRKMEKRIVNISALDRHVKLKKRPALSGGPGQDGGQIGIGNYKENEKLRTLGLNSPWTTLLLEVNRFPAHDG